MKININTLWDTLMQDVKIDGLVCEIGLANITLQDWRVFFLFVSNNFTYTFFNKNPDQLLPSKVDETFFNNEELRFLEISIGKFKLDCPILRSDLIEINVFPAMITEQSQIDLFFKFVRDVGNILQKEVFIKIEGSTKPLITYSYSTNSFVDKMGNELFSN